MKSQLELLFGTELDSLKADQTTAFAMLKSENHKDRVGAILLLREHFEIDEEIMDPLCREYAMHDPHDQVRGIALSQLGKMYHSSGDGDVSRFLAEISVNESEPTKVRSSAFMSLRKVNAAPQSIAEQEAFIDRVTETISLIRHPKLDQDQLEWARTFLS